MHRLPGVWRLFTNGFTTVLTTPSDDRDRYHVLTNFGADLTLVVEIQALLSSHQLPLLERSHQLAVHIRYSYSSNQRTTKGSD